MVFSVQVSVSVTVVILVPSVVISAKVSVAFCWSLWWSLYPVVISVKVNVTWWSFYPLWSGGTHFFGPRFSKVVSMEQTIWFETRILGTSFQ